MASSAEWVVALNDQNASSKQKLSCLARLAELARTNPEEALGVFEGIEAAVTMHTSSHTIALALFTFPVPCFVGLHFFSSRRRFSTSRRRTGSSARRLAACMRRLC